MYSGETFVDDIGTTGVAHLSAVSSKSGPNALLLRTEPTTIQARAAGVDRKGTIGRRAIQRWVFSHPSWFCGDEGLQNNLDQRAEFEAEMTSK